VVADQIDTAGRLENTGRRTLVKAGAMGSDRL
jgi:hypothetical protein